MNNKTNTLSQVYAWNKFFTYVRHTTGVPAKELDALLKQYSISIAEKPYAIKAKWLIKEDGIYTVPEHGQMTAERYDAVMTPLREARRVANAKQRSPRKVTVDSFTKEQLIAALKAFKLPNGESEFIIRRKAITITEEEV